MFTFGTSITHTNLSLSSLLSLVSSISYLVLDTKEMCQANPHSHSFMLCSQAFHRKYSMWLWKCSEHEWETRRIWWKKRRTKPAVFLVSPSREPQRWRSKRTHKGMQKNPSIKPNPAWERQNELQGGRQGRWYTVYYFDVKFVIRNFFIL